MTLSSPAAGRPPTAHGIIADALRTAIGTGTFPPSAALPTEFELCRQHGVSRQTVRRAYQDLVSEGLVYRVPGRGTFVTDHGGKYLRSSGSIEQLLALSVDSDLEILVPPRRTTSLDAAGRLHLEIDEIVEIRFRRLHQGRPYCVTTASFPVDFGQRLLEIEELASPGVRPNLTILQIVQDLAGEPFAGADQSITATRASSELADALECSQGDPVLRIDRLYHDRHGELLELAVNHFNPDRYTYRVSLQARG
jgi:DNA-binding GntR family transcriptional regulator